jgi:hypothetical protein
VIADPSVGDYATCLACHRDLPDEFPEDRLRTPHDQFTHGSAVDVYCSDCHGAVGHGFDPVSGDVICPMDVCMDCHIERQLEARLSDCAACHVGPHDPVAGMSCSDCHVSAETWTPFAAGEHVVDLVGRHAAAPCFDCHDERQQPLSYECSSCHEPPGQSHYGPDCGTCHAPEGFETVMLPEHPVELVGAHQTVLCVSCHGQGQAAQDAPCERCHARPDDHLTGPCEMCHTPEGWETSARSMVRPAPPITHDLADRTECLLCHEPTGQILPAPGDHEGYANGQCGLCHKAGP